MLLYSYEKTPFIIKNPIYDCGFVSYKFKQIFILLVLMNQDTPYIWILYLSAHEHITMSPQCCVVIDNLGGFDDVDVLPKNEGRGGP